jgi:hypothetical protein
MAACAALALLLQRASPQLQWSGLAIAAVARRRAVGIGRRRLAAPRLPVLFVNQTLSSPQPPVAAQPRGDGLRRAGRRRHLDGRLGVALFLEQVAASPDLLLGTTPLVVGIQFACFLWSACTAASGATRSVHDVKQIVKAAALSAVLVPTALVLLRHAQGIPRTLFILDPLLLVFLMAGGRIGYRW